MTRLEVSQLLAILARFDARQSVDELTVESWYAIPEIAAASLTVAREIAVAHQTAPGPYEVFAVRHLVAGLRRRARTTPTDIATDVRVAKARGIIPADWPANEPLTPQHADALAAARERDRQETLRHSVELEGGRR